jgi:hypothetical protein
MVNPTKIIVRKPQIISGFQILPFFAERIGQPRHAPHSHPDIEVLALDMACANPPLVGITHDSDWDRIHNLARAVPLLSLTGRRIDLHELSEADPTGKVLFHCPDVGFEPVAG